MYVLYPKFGKENDATGVWERLLEYGLVEAWQLCIVIKASGSICFRVVSDPVNNRRFLFQTVLVLGDRRRCIPSLYGVFVCDKKVKKVRGLDENASIIFATSFVLWCRVSRLPFQVRVY